MTRGPLVRGVMLADDIQPKVVSRKSHVHESTLSRFFNGHADVDDEKLIRICIAIGEVREANKRRALA